MRLPLEIWLEILDQVAGSDQVQTLSVLCRVSKCLHDLATPRLYGDLHFIIEKSCSLGSRLTQCLLLPGHDQKWGKLVKGVCVTIGGGCPEEYWDAVKGFVFLGIALVLERIEPNSLEKFRWNCGVKPHKMVTDALLKQKKMRSLDFWMPYSGGTSPIFEVFGTDHLKYLRKLVVKGIQNEEQLGEVAAALKHMDLTDITLYSEPGDGLIESLDIAWVLPPQLKDGVSNLTSIGLSLFNLSDLKSHINSFFNPCTLRTLSLSDCCGYAALLTALSTHSGVRRNLCSLSLSSSADCDITGVIDLVAACGNLKEVSLCLFSFDKITIRQLLDATQGSRESLELLSLELEGGLFYEQHWLQALKSMKRLRQLAVNCKMNTVDLMEVGIHFPESLRVAVIGFPAGALELSDDPLLTLVGSFCNARPDLPFLDTIAIVDGERFEQRESWFGISFSEGSRVPFSVTYRDYSYMAARADRRILMGQFVI